jgi:hypothetical protein
MRYPLNTFRASDLLIGTNLSAYYCSYNNLGRWAKRMRDGISKNEPWMDDIKKARLLGINFDIEARQVFDHPVKVRAYDYCDEEADGCV